MNNKVCSLKNLRLRVKAVLLLSLTVFNFGNIRINSKVLENKDFKTRNKDYVVNKYDKKVAKIAIPAVVVSLILFGAWYFSGGASKKEKEEDSQIIEPNVDPKCGLNNNSNIIKLSEIEKNNSEYKQALEDWKVARAEYLGAATSFDEDSKPMLYVLATCMDLFYCSDAYNDEPDVWANYKKIDFDFAKNAFAGAVININENYADQVLGFISGLSLSMGWGDFYDAVGKFLSSMNLRLKYYEVLDFMKEEVDGSKKVSYDNLFKLIIPKRLDIEQQKQILLGVSKVLNDEYWKAASSKGGFTISFINLKRGSIKALCDLGFYKKDLDCENANACKEVFKDLEGSSEEIDREILSYLEFMYEIGKQEKCSEEDEKKFWSELPKLSKKLVRNELRKMNIDQSEINDELVEIVAKNVLSRSYPVNKIKDGFKGVK